MREFMILISQIFLIGMLQTVLESFFDGDKKSTLKLISIACFVGSLYLVLQFVFTYVLREITTIVKLPF